MRGLPWWFWFGVGIVKYWYVTIPLAIALAVAESYAAPWLGGLRWLLIAVVVLLALPFPVAAFIVTYQSHDATRYWRALDVAETIADLPLPAGSKVHFADKAHSTVASIELPHETEIRGMRLTGPLIPWKRKGAAVTHWGGNLAADQRVDDLPCRAGPYPNDRAGGVIFNDAGDIQRCTLATPHDLLGLKLPAGTTVSRGDEAQPWSFLLPADADVYIPVLATMVPGGVTLDIASDERLVRIGSGHGQIIHVRGVPLNSKTFELLGDIVVSELAEPFFIDGELRPSATTVQVNLKTGKATVVSQ